MGIGEWCKCVKRLVGQFVGGYMHGCGEVLWAVFVLEMDESGWMVGWLGEFGRRG